MSIDYYWSSSGYQMSHSVLLTDAKRSLRVAEGHEGSPRGT